jgi:hypothetical protein
VLNAPRGLIPNDGTFFGRCGQGLFITGSMGDYNGPVVFYEWQVTIRDEGGTSVQTETTQDLYLERKQMPCNMSIALQARAIVGNVERMAGPFSEPVQVVILRARPTVTPTHTRRPTRTPTPPRLQIAPTSTPPRLQIAPTSTPPRLQIAPVPTKERVPVP